MSAPVNFQFYTDTFRHIDNATTNYVLNLSEVVIGSTFDALKQLLIVYVIIWGVAMASGNIQEPIMDALKRVLRMSVVIGIGANVATYNTEIANFLWTWPDALALKLAGTEGTGTGTISFLDALMGQMYQLGQSFWTKAQANSSYGIPDLGLLGISIAIWAGGILTTAYSAFLMCLAKIALAVLLAIGPVFIALTLFDATRKFFEGWLGQVLNYGFLVVLTAGVCKMILNILQAYLLSALPAAQANASIVQALPALAISVIGLLVLAQLGAIASALAGGAAMTTMGAGSLLSRKAAGALGAARPSNLRRSMRGLKADGRALKQAMGAPKAMYKALTQGRPNKVANG
ncbi:type IV secretion system protein [Achromobacter spanius]|uniref:type IV secretion system protein n=1 Tax=Achromobacter spanius TaxID=217203 RepID=UPI0038267BB4